MRTVYTVGYGGWSLVELVEVLRALGVNALADVRRWNTSRRNPAFSGTNLSRVLGDAGIAYFWFPELGGYRKFGVDVQDKGIARCFESEGFRAYATYITTSALSRPHLEALVETAMRYTTALLCCERYPWMCHRKILSDYLLAKGFRVLHILSRDKLAEHKLSSCASVKNGELVYTW